VRNAHASLKGCTGIVHEFPRNPLERDANLPRDLLIADRRGLCNRVTKHLYLISVRSHRTRARDRSDPSPSKWIWIFMPVGANDSPLAVSRFARETFASISTALRETARADL